MSNANAIQRALVEAVARRDVAAPLMQAAFADIMQGLATPAQIGGLLAALACKGESAGELAGAALAMRSHAIALPLPDPERAVDTCGTGGDHSGTVNISTLAAIMVAAQGLTVVKHGNRALTSKSGSADVLEALGIAIDVAPSEVARGLNAQGIAFAFAPRFHAATKHAAGPRRELGVRTLFNLLGPLSNPAGVPHQVVGVFAPAWCEPMAEALALLGARAAFVVHGYYDASRTRGYDEVAVSGPTQVVLVRHGQRLAFELMPADFGLPLVSMAGLAGGDAAFNADVLTSVLKGEHAMPGTARYAVSCAAAMTAALAVYAVRLGDPAHPSFDSGQLARLTADAMATLRDGQAASVLARWRAAAPFGVPHE